MAAAQPIPYKFIGFGDIHGPKPYKFTGFGDIHGPKPYKFIGFGDMARFAFLFLFLFFLVAAKCCRDGRWASGPDVGRIRVRKAAKSALRQAFGPREI